MRERLPTLAAIVDLMGFLWVDELAVDPALVVPKRWDAATTAEGSWRPANASRRTTTVTWEADELEPPLRELAEARGWKAGDLFMAMRVATTGRRRRRRCSTRWSPWAASGRSRGSTRHREPRRRGRRLRRLRRRAR